MKKVLLEILVCPDCAVSLVLKEEVVEQGEVKEGRLLCSSCNKQYYIKNFIPRFVNTDHYVDNFSFQWNRFYDVQIDILNNTDEAERTFMWKTGWKPEDLKGKLVLDVGVGAGRFADVVSRWGGSVIGIDLSFAVEAAHKNIGKRDNVHIIQADIFHLPFKKSFDNIYSIGVLHHTSDTEKAFKAVTPCIKTGGEYAVFLYAFGNYHYFSDIWRKITTKLPIQITYYLLSVAIPLFYIQKIPLVGKILQVLLPISSCPYWKGRWLDTLDWYSPTYQWKHTWPEVYKWYKEAGFVDIELYQENKVSSLGQICMRGKKN